MLQMWAWISGGVYRNWCLDALESSFTLNLIILAASTMYTYHRNGSEGNQLVVGYISVSIAFLTFIGILVFQLAKVIGITHHLKRKCAQVTNVNQAEVEVMPPDVDSLPDRLINPGEYEPPFHTPQNKHVTAESTEQLVSEAQRRLTPVYTYGSIN